VVVTTALYLLALRPPRTGPLAVLWWAAVVAFLVLAAVYTIRGRLGAQRRNETSADSGGVYNPSPLVLWFTFLVVVALVSVVLFALRVIPGA
jgi:Na+/H+ antiporter NhaC